MNREEYTVTSQTEQVFANEKIKPQYFILNKYYIDLLLSGAINWQ